MERHEININTMFGEPVVADIEHQPHNDEKLQVVFYIKHIPKLFTSFPGVKKLIANPIPMLVQRDFIRAWGERLIKWADEPTPAIEGSLADD